MQRQLIGNLDEVTDLRLLGSPAADGAFSHLAVATNSATVRLFQLEPLGCCASLTGVHTDTVLALDTTSHLADPHTPGNWPCLASACTWLLSGKQQADGLHRLLRVAGTAADSGHSTGDASSHPHTCSSQLPRDDAGQQVTLLAAGAKDACVSLWRVDKGQAACLGSVRGHMGAVTALTFARKGAFLVSGGADKLLKART